MVPVQNSYRTTKLLVRLFGTVILSFSQICAAAQVAKTAVAQISKAAVTQQGKDANTPPVVEKASASLQAMNDSISKQRIAVQSQLNSTVKSDSFFTVAWSTPASIDPPMIIPTCGPMPEDELKEIVAVNAKAQDLKPEVIRAVIRRESDSYPCAVSQKGALGLMQLMPDTAQQFGVDPLDATQNVQAGAKYLKQLMTRYKGDLKLALAAYNAGPDRVDADKKVPDIPETVAYVDAILKDLTPKSVQHK